MDANSELPSYYPPFLPKAPLEGSRYASGPRLPSITEMPTVSPTPTPATTPGAFLPNPNASPFVSKRVTIRSESGKELDLERFRTQVAPPRRPVAVRIESEDGRRERLLSEAAERGEDVTELRAKLLAETQGKKLTKAQKKKAKAKAREEPPREELAERSRKQTGETTKDSASTHSTAAHDDANSQAPPTPLKLSPTKDSFSSALVAARVIGELDHIPYPEGINRPTPGLNAKARQGKFRYDRAFLLQFASVCKEKPASLQFLHVPPLNIIALSALDKDLSTIHRGRRVPVQTSTGPQKASANDSAPRGSSETSAYSPFGRMGQVAPVISGPAFATHTYRGKSEGIPTSQQGSSSMLASTHPEGVDEITMRSSLPRAKGAHRVGVSPAGSVKMDSQRRPLMLLPRTIPTSSGSRPSYAYATASTSGASASCGIGTSLPTEEANIRIQKYSKKFFNTRDLSKAEAYFTSLLVEYRHLLVTNLVARAIDLKEDDAELVAALFARAYSQNLCSPSAFEEGFTPMAKQLDRIAVGNWKAVYLFAVMAKGAHLHEDKARCARLIAHSVDCDQLVSLLSS
ncbi:hypothetical protein C2E23DRAFT_882690 [Lenzites betulinus]|nr:hypothetical protein C2E23DRAFT_882690 [Lenzites betulinus]